MRSILIVDDQLCVRKLLSEELTREGYAVDSLGNPESVMARLTSSRPDLVLLDLYLDGLEGFGLFEDIKRQHPDLPVIIVSAYDSFRDDPRLSDAHGYVVKSIHLGELKQRITQVLTRQRTDRTIAQGESHCRQLGLAYGF